MTMEKEESGGEEVEQVLVQPFGHRRKQGVRLAIIFDEGRKRDCGGGGPAGRIDRYVFVGGAVDDQRGQGRR
jgi:hypothetical protein